ncbi:MAG TPA: sulfatase [Thermoanaerobaculia bacterium]|jgi:arylsulfatase A-like enzyme|nr:sulfatase [Thermoanaerobaculia bacterium]
MRLLSFLLSILFLAGCGPRVAEDAPRRVFFITVDTLRADHMSLYGYPRQTSPELARLAAGGVTFDRTITQWPKTGASFASMFTGQYPQTTGLTHRAAMRVPEEYLTLPELFQESGYTTLGVVSNAVLAAKFGWNDGFDEFLETWGSGDFPDDPHAFRNLVHAPKVNELALSLLEKHAKADRLFVWLHYTDPHAPYMLPDGVANPFLDDALFQGDTAVPRKVARGYKLGGRDDLKYYVAQYDANVLVADMYIRKVLDRARELGLLEDSLIVFTADHGESLSEHDSWFEHGPLPYNTTAHVPLFFVRNGVRDGLAAGSRIGRPVELIDLYPTLRDLVVPGYEVPGLEGKSLAGFLRGKDSTDFRLAFSEAGEKPRYFRSVQDGKWKLVLGVGGKRPTGLELYDLAADPQETRNVATLHPEELRRLRAELMGWVKNRPGRHAGQEEDEETLKALRALGYAN